MKNSLIMLLVMFSLSNIVEAANHIIMVKKVISIHISPKKVIAKKAVAHKSGHKHHVIVPKVHNDGVTGIASWYGYESVKKHKPTTANGDVFLPSKLTAAHRSLPFGTKVSVTNLKNHKSVIVVINDRGPYIHGRLIDLSKSAAKSIGMDGIQRVSLTVVNG